MNLLRNSLPFILILGSWEFGEVYSVQVLGPEPARSQNDRQEVLIIALEASKKLLAPKELVARVDRDLEIIRRMYPSMRDIRHTASWVPGHLFASVTDEQIEKIDDSKYGPIDKEERFTDTPYAHLVFEKKYNPILLSRLLKKNFKIDTTEPIALIGGGSKINYNINTKRYSFKRAKEDCSPGCDKDRFWTFHVDDEGRLKLLFEYEKIDAMQSLLDDPYAYVMKKEANLPLFL